MKRAFLILALALCCTCLCACGSDDASKSATVAAPTAALSEEATSSEPTPIPTEVPLDYLFIITVHPPTCRANGYSVYVSRETGCINIRDEVSRLPHDFSVPVVDEETGEIRMACSMCGKLQDENGE